jgi:hypothetical protein
MSTCLSHLCGLERGPMISGSAESLSDAEMLEAAWTLAIEEDKKVKKPDSPPSPKKDDARTSWAGC